LKEHPEYVREFNLSSNEINDLELAINAAINEFDNVKSV